MHVSIFILSINAESKLGWYPSSLTSPRNNVKLPTQTHILKILKPDDHRKKRSLILSICLLFSLPIRSFKHPLSLLGLVMKVLASLTDLAIPQERGSPTKESETDWVVKYLGDPQQQTHTFVFCFVNFPHVWWLNTVAVHTRSLT